MSPFELVLLALSSIAKLTSNPDLGGGGLHREDTARLLTMLHDILQRGEQAYGQLKAFAEEVGRMAKDSVQPMPKDFEALEARTKAAHDEIQSYSLDNQIREALESLDPADDSLWTADGTPKVEAVSRLLNRVVTRAQIDEAAPDFVRESLE